MGSHPQADHPHFRQDFNRARTADFSVKSVVFAAGAAAVVAIAVETGAIADAMGAEAGVLAAIANESAAGAVAIMTGAGASRPDEVACEMETVLSEPEKGLVGLRRLLCVDHTVTSCGHSSNS